MSAFNRFSPEQLDALKRGRAIPFLIEHRSSACPNHTLSVLATIDDEFFVGVFLPDDEPDCELVEAPLPSLCLPQPYPLASDAPDALAVHRLWSQWDAGVRDQYLEFFALMGRVLARARLDEALAVAPPTPAPDTPASPPRPKGRKSAGRKPKATKRRAHR